MTDQPRAFAALTTASSDVLARLVADVEVAEG